MTCVCRSKAYESGPAPISRGLVFLCLLFIALSGSLAVISSANAQSFEKPRAGVFIHKHSRFCSFLGHSDIFKERLPLTVFAPDKSEGTQNQAQVGPLIQWIQDYSGVQANLEVYSGEVLNAAAVLFRDGKSERSLRRAIVYHPQFRDYLSKRTKVRGQPTPWPVASVFAHEVGHHLAGHTLRSANQRHFELQADWFSGYILGRMGSTLTGVQQTFRTFWLPEGSPTHPSSPDRLAAVSDGWWQAQCEKSGQAAGQCDRVRTPFVKLPAKKEEELKSVNTRMLCNIRGEQMAVGKVAKTGKTELFWLRHYTEHPTKVGDVLVGDGRAGRCRYRFRGLLGESRFDFCAEGASKARHLTISDSSVAGDKSSIGHCRICTVRPRQKG